MDKIKKFITNTWVIPTFISGGGYGTYQFFYGNNVDIRKEWVRDYAQSASGIANVNGRHVEITWDILKVPPSEEYDLHIYCLLYTSPSPRDS